MRLEELPDAELGVIIRESPLWSILLTMEKNNEKNKKTNGTEKR